MGGGGGLHSQCCTWTALRRCFIVPTWTHALEINGLVCQKFCRLPYEYLHNSWMECSVWWKKKQKNKKKTAWLFAKCFLIFRCPSELITLIRYWGWLNGLLKKKKRLSAVITWLNVLMRTQQKSNFLQEQIWSLCFSLQRTEKSR